MDHGITKWRESLESRDEYWVQKAKTYASLDLENLLRASGLTKAQWAEKIGKSKAYVSKLFSHDVNFTIETLVRLARSLDGEVVVRVVPSSAAAQTNVRMAPVGRISLPVHGKEGSIGSVHVHAVRASNDLTYADVA